MYTFILNQYVMGKITEAKVRSYAPRYISETEANMILLTPQL
ncbi:hypothetical protein [Paenibacillus wynnii]|nr:hypothetical protein [Paenibacillus wynnii]